LATAVIAALFMPVSMASADEFQSEMEDLMEALTTGKVTFNWRSRMELANEDGRSKAQAYTTRLRIGYGTASYYGFSAYADMEHIAAASENTFWGKAYPDNGETVIADPEDTQLNQAYLKFQSDDWGFAVAGGRQRIILDDSRFVGNVGWRQNEQTFDSATLKGSFGVENLELFYGYLWEVKRIFGDQGPIEGTRDFDSDSHLINASYKLGCGKLTAFAYILDFNNGVTPHKSSNNTFGTRFAGNRDFSDNWGMGYQLSYAFQEDGDNNPANYKAHYVLADINAGYKPLGKLGFTFELQDSDGGDGSFNTPLATLHKFNGFADVFLTSNTPDGLRDYSVYVAPNLPWGLKGKFIYHHFDSDYKSKSLGNEYDLVLSRTFLKHFTVLSKAAFFDGKNGMKDINRFWLEATLAF
jgi:hypothetical protein